MTDVHTFDYSPQGRAGRTTYLLALKGSMTTGQIAESVGLSSGAAVRAMMANLGAAGVPIYQPERGHWAIEDQELTARFGHSGGVPEQEFRKDLQ